MHANAERKQPDTLSLRQTDLQRSQGEHVYAQRYCTEESRHPVGFIDFVIDANGHSQYVVRIPQGVKPFLSLVEAEAWLQTRVLSGSRLVKG